MTHDAFRHLLYGIEADLARAVEAVEVQPFLALPYGARNGEVRERTVEDLRESWWALGGVIERLYPPVRLQPAQGKEQP